MAEISGIPHQFVYVDDDDRYWAADCECGKVVNIGAGNVFLDENDEEVRHVVSDEGDIKATWYEIFPEQSSDFDTCYTSQNQEIISIKLERVSPGHQGAGKTAGVAIQNLTDQSGHGFHLCSNHYTSPPYSGSMSKNDVLPKEVPQIIHNWKIRQPRSHKEYHTIMGLIQNPEKLLISPPHESFCLENKVESTLSFDNCNSFPLDGINSAVENFLNSEIPNIFNENPNFRYITKKICFHLIQEYLEGKVNFDKLLANLNSCNRASYFELLESLVDDIILHDEVTEKTMECLGHHIFDDQCKDRSHVKHKSGRHVDFYEKNVNVKKLVTSTVHRNRKKNDRRPYLMSIYLTHQDNFLGCNHYKMNSKIVHQYNYPQAGLQILKDRSLNEGESGDELLNVYAKHCLNFCFDFDHLLSGSQTLGEPEKFCNFKEGQIQFKFGGYTQALAFLSDELVFDSSNKNAYLWRSFAEFATGNYESSVQDFKKYASLNVDKNLPSKMDFVKEFTKSIPEGIKDSSSGLFLLVSDLIHHPVHTATQIYSSIKTIVEYASEGEWDLLGESLVPELYDLIQNWDTLDLQEQGKISGYIFGKYGSDILIPGALVKVGSKGIKGLRRLHALQQTVQTAENTLVLESVSRLGNGVKIAETLENSQKVIAAGNEMGLSVRQMFKLKEAGRLEKNLIPTYEGMFKNPALQASFEQTYRAETFLKPYRGKFLSEMKARELIEKAGLPTFPKPEGIPDHFLVKITKKGGGMSYVDPSNSEHMIRVMPGKPHSEMVQQQKSYVVHMKDGKALNSTGTLIDKKLPEAHIPLEEYIFKN